MAGSIDDENEVVLDEAFVKGATVTELGHAKRRRAARWAGFKRGVAAPFRRSGRFLRRNFKSVAILTVGIPLVAIIGITRWHNNNETKTPFNDFAVLGAGVTTSTTDTTLALTDRSYKAGDCVDWDQQLDKGDYEKRTKVVPCDQPHLFEYVSSFSARNGEYPSDSEWDAISSAACDPAIASYLGYALDPNGKFRALIIHPVDDGWKQGERDVKCGINIGDPHTLPDDPNPLSVPYTGVVKGQDQTDVMPIGTCRSQVRDNWTADVPCTQAHNYEIVGSVDISKSTKSLPKSSEDWSRLTKNCVKQASDYAGGSLPSGMSVGWMPFPQSSWDAGRRVVECTVARWNGDNSAPVTGSVKAGGKPTTGVPA